MFFKKPAIKHLVFSNVDLIINFYDEESSPIIDKGLKSKSTLQQTGNTLLIKEKNRFTMLDLNINININGIETIKFINSEVTILNKNMLNNIDFNFDTCSVVFKSLFCEKLNFISNNSLVYFKNGFFIKQLITNLENHSVLKADQGYIEKLDVFINASSELSFPMNYVYVSNVDLNIAKGGQCSLYGISDVSYSIEQSSDLRLFGNPDLTMKLSRRTNKEVIDLFAGAISYNNPSLVIDNAIFIKELLTLEIDEALDASLDHNFFFYPSSLDEEVCKLKKRLRAEKAQEESKVEETIDLSISEFLSREEELLAIEENSYNKTLQGKKGEIQEIKEGSVKIESYLLDILNNKVPTNFINESNLENILLLIKESFNSKTKLNETQLCNRKKLCVLFDIEHENSEVIF